jgi:hypothetical protein
MRHATRVALVSFWNWRTLSLGVPERKEVYMGADHERKAIVKIIAHSALGAQARKELEGTVLRDIDDAAIAEILQDHEVGVSTPEDLAEQFLGEGVSL